METLNLRKPLTGLCISLQGRGAGGRLFSQPLPLPSFMNFLRTAFVALSFAACCLTASVRAVDMPPDPDLPQPFDPSAVLGMIKNPPFSRVVDYSDSLQLTGVAYVEGKPMATLVDKATKKRYVVSEEPNAQGWKLAQATMSNELHATEVKLLVGEELVTFRYSQSQLTLGKVNPNGPPSSSSSSGSSSGSPTRPVLMLSDADQAFYRSGMSKEARDKFGATMGSHEDKMAKMTDAQRAAYTQKIFSKIKAQDQGAPPPVKVKSKK